MLAAMAATVAVTVTAFVYLDWWQAILAVCAFLTVLFLGGKFLLHTAIQAWGEQITKLTAGQAVVLRNATLQVHKVERSEPPRELTSDDDDEFADDDPEFRRERDEELFGKTWYKIELTVFPNPDIEESTQPWSPHALTFVDEDAEPPRNMLNASDEGIYVPARMKIVSQDTAHEDESELSGPQRLRFLVGIRSELRAVAVRYFTEQFGRVRLPGPLDDSKRLGPS
jgi:hypothetical protein